MPQSSVHINLYGFVNDFPTQREKEILWEKAKRAAEKLAEETGIPISSVSVR